MPDAVQAPVQQFDLIVFDWDGTLVDSIRMIARAIQQAAADLGLEVPDDERASHVIGLGLHDALAYAVPGLPPARIGEFAERYRVHFIDHEHRQALFDGAHELVAALAARGTTLAIATGKTVAGLRRSLAASGLEPYFRATRCADQTLPKPHPAMLHELMAELGHASGRTLMIGDTTHDLGMAAAAGTAAVGVTYGAHPRAQLADATPAPLALVDSIADLRRWLLGS